MTMLVEELRVFSTYLRQHARAAETRAAESWDVELPAAELPAAGEDCRGRRAGD